MLLGFGELNLHACTIEFECKVASISNALLIYHTRTARCPYVAILGRHFPFAHQLSPQDSHTLKNMYGFFTFACENPRTLILVRFDEDVILAHSPAGETAEREF